VKTFCDLSGREVGIGRCLGQGGEGAVYSLPMLPKAVAKIYARRPDGPTSRKLAAMVQLATEELATCAAWPQNLLLDPRTGDAAGFLMPRIDGHREIHRLYGPSDRKTAFPDASWAFLVRVARNVASAFDTVHRHGHVIGDVNQGNVVVSRDATVRLIDCDSFQITHLGRTYHCRVGVPLFTPPELQGKKLDCIERTADHDSFGLAVLVFQLLFMGRHPFAGRHPERAIPAEAAIREGLFAFGGAAAAQGWEPPPFSLRLRDVSPPVARLFQRAFGPGAVAGEPRPSAAEWVPTLDAFEPRLVTCCDDPRHVYAPVNGCPWCRIENEGGPSYFFLPQGTAADAFDLAAAWRAIEAVRSPGKAPVPAPPAPEPAAAPGLSTLALRALRGLIGPLLGSQEQGPRANGAEEGLQAALENVRRLEEQWRGLCGDEPFERLRDELGRAKADLEGLGAVESREWQELTERYRAAKLPDHLRTFPFEFARIPGLGSAEIARLAARNITTAADVTAERLMAIHGIDLGLVRGLLLFKRMAARAFNFDPVAGIPGRERRALEESQRRRHEALADKLRGGAVQLAELRRQTVQWRDVLARGLAEAQRRVRKLQHESR
jgi:DNA-binding helix-hairpin-helix protein with protein kinase domain